MPQRTLALYRDEIDDRAPTRLCVAVSDLHLTDGSVGTQSLPVSIWQRFFDDLRARCLMEQAGECVVILDGDVIDLIRSSRWAEAGVYPWQREHPNFPEIVLEIVENIVSQHREFFALLQGLPVFLQEAGVETTEIFVLVGNHDKEMLVVPQALSHFYQHGLGIETKNLAPQYRRWIGQMYFADPDYFAAPDSVPYLPFYYGDRGFKFFTTHGQWRDGDNSIAVEPSEQAAEGWSIKDGWQPERWQKMGFKPFIEPCFGDTVAAGVLSTFIYEAKVKLRVAGYREPRLHRILDELDLYRPTYLAVTRILEETKRMKSLQPQKVMVAKVLEETLFDCVMRWLSWDFTFASAPFKRRWILRAGRGYLKLIKFFKHGFKISAIAWLMRIMAGLDRWNQYLRTSEPLSTLLALPAFLPEYRHYGFRIHGEGHTHTPLQEEVNVGEPTNHTYVNFGTWRDRIVKKNPSGYRRRSVMRAFYILDKAPPEKVGRVFSCFARDAWLWGDHLDQLEAMVPASNVEPKPVI